MHRRDWLRTTHPEITGIRLTLENLLSDESGSTWRIFVLEHFELLHETVVLVLNILDTLVTISILEELRHCELEIAGLNETVPFDGVCEPIWCGCHSDLPTLHHLPEISVVLPPLDDIIAFNASFDDAWTVFAHKLLVEFERVVSDLTVFNLFDLGGGPELW